MTGAPKDQTLELNRADHFMEDARRCLSQAREACSRALACSSGPQQGRIRQRLWRIDQMLHGPGRWFSEAGQDRCLDTEVFDGKRCGTFVDIGAYDGIVGSNTLFFEMFRGWSGLLVEAVPAYAAEARANRRSPCIEVAVSAEESVADFLQITAGYTQMSGLVSSYDPALLARARQDNRHRECRVRVPTQRLDQLLRAHELHRIDYVSIDIEGAELATLSVFPFAEFDITAWSVENARGDPALGRLMVRNGYCKLADIGVDELFVRDR